MCSRNVSKCGMGLSMAAVEAGFDESLENVSLSVGQEEVIRNSDFQKKQHSIFYY